MAKQNKKENTITLNDKEYKIDNMDANEKSFFEIDGERWFNVRSRC